MASPYSLKIGPLTKSFLNITMKIRRTFREKNAKMQPKFYVGYFVAIQKKNNSGEISLISDDLKI